MDNFRAWLNSVTHIVQKQQEIAAIRGENYNIFKVIHMTSNETSVHSAFIADLLNPKGLHGMGNQFLRLFVEAINTHGFVFSIEDSKTEIEKDIGPRKATTGGRLDIIVSNKDQAIIIENKIYAEDQEAQMLRYHNFAKGRYPRKHLLLYLSLDGLVHDVDFTTKGKIKEGEEFFTISYKEDILNWLFKCRQLAVEKPLLREGLTHYINLVKSLTHNNMNAQTKKEMTDIVVNNPTYIKNLKVYADAIESSMKELTIVFWKSLFAKLLEANNDALRIVEIRGERQSLIKIIKHPSEADIVDSAMEFRLRGQRPRGYNYKFGLALPVVCKGGQMLVAGIMIDQAITFRVFVENQEGHVPYSEVDMLFKKVREYLGENAFPRGVWAEDFYICAVRPGNSERWDIGSMNDAVLENLSNMGDCIETIVKEYDSFCANLKGIIENN